MRGSPGEEIDLLENKQVMEENVERKVTCRSAGGERYSFCWRWVTRMAAAWSRKFRIAV